MSNLHIVKYAKGHYGKSGDIFKDLSLLITIYSGWHPEIMSERDIVHCVQMMWEEVGEFRDEFPNKLYEESWWAHNKEKSMAILMVEVMLSNMRFIKKGPNGESLGDYLPENYPDIFFGDEDDLKRIKKQLPSCFGAGI